MGRLRRAGQEAVLVQLPSIAQHFRGRMPAGRSSPPPHPPPPRRPSDTPLVLLPCCQSGNSLPIISCPWVSREATARHQAGSREQGQGDLASSFVRPEPPDNFAKEGCEQASRQAGRQGRGEAAAGASPERPSRSGAPGKTRVAGREDAGLQGPRMPAATTPPGS